MGHKVGVKPLVLLVSCKHSWYLKPWYSMRSLGSSLKRGSKTEIWDMPIFRLKEEENGPVEETEKWIGWEERENSVPWSPVPWSPEINISSAVDKYNKMKPENHPLNLAT